MVHDMHYTMRPLLALAAAVLAFSTARVVFAGDEAPWPQPLFTEPPLSSDAGHLLEGTATAPKWAWYSKIDLRWAYGAGVSDRAHQTRGDLVFGMGLPANLEAALALPIVFTVGTHVVRDGVFELDGMGKDGAGIGDLRAGLSWSALSAESGGLGLSFGVAAFVPTGDNARLLGEGGFGGEATASLALKMFGAGLGLNLGYRLRPEHVVKAPGARFEQDDDIIWRIGIRVPRKNDIAWSIEAAGDIGVATYEGVWPSADSRPVWLGGGVDFPIGRRSRLGALAGFGIGELTPLFTVALRLSMTPVAPDEDLDGISGGADKCPLFPEDADGFEDDDGCPDGDNDKDSFPDDEDACPNQAGGEESEDGC
jgi:OmpA-OmpF porin, OOP family